MYNESRNIRDMIDGELNRIAVTDDTDEFENDGLFSNKYK